MKSFLHFIAEENWTDQKFGDGKNEYSVAKVVEWAKKNGEYIECLPIKDTDGLKWWDKSYGDKDGNPKSQKERDKLENADFSYPILVVKYSNKYSVADGLHRVKKASLAGKDCLPAYAIEQDDLKKISELSERVVRQGDEWVVKGESGGEHSKKVFGKHSSRKKAMKQLAAIEISKTRRGK